VANFAYVAIDKFGKEKKGSIEAENEEKVKSVLKGDGLIPLSVSEQGLLSKDISIDIGGGVKPRDLSIFCRQFLSMVQAGVTIIDTLAMLTEQTENKKMRQAIRETQVSIEKGDTLADAMKMHPKVFPSILVNMVAAGEASGSLEISFGRMSEHFEKDAKLKGMMKKAMIYPIVVGIVAVVVVIVMLAFVIPNFSSVFADMGTELPKITQIVVTASDFIRQRWYIIAVVIAAIVFAVVSFKATPTGQHFFGKLGIKLPVFGNMTVKSASARLARTLSTLMAAGISMVDAIEITAKTMDNIWFKEALMSARDDIMRGVPLSVPLQNSGLFPPMVCHMTKIGEETGNVEDMLHKLADYYDEEVEMATQAMMAALEPLIIVILAGVVGVLIGAVMAPMLTMYTNLDSL